MYVTRLEIENIRSLEHFRIDLTEEECPGWHVVLGSNGAGKSTVIRSLAVALAGPKEVAALRQTWASWQKQGADDGQISLSVIPHDADIFTGTGRRSQKIEAKVGLQSAETTLGRRVDLVATITKSATVWRSLWGTNAGWFCASFGPFRRFTGGDRDYDRLFYSNPRLAPHLSAFGEDVALTEGLRWLQTLRVKSLEYTGGESDLLDALISFLNVSGLLPHGAVVAEVRVDEIIVVDGAGTRVSIEQMSDGYRSVLSMIFEILRQMSISFGEAQLVNGIDYESGVVELPGVVAIDEIDAHLHPSWQRDIGPWFVRCFPNVQFIVTTHTPIICRNAKSVWRLSNPGEGELGDRVEGSDLHRLIYGSILDAYGTEFFGKDLERSEESRTLLEELALLNRISLRRDLTPAETVRLEHLRGALPTESSDTLE